MRVTSTNPTATIALNPQASISAGNTVIISITAYTQTGVPASFTCSDTQGNSYALDAFDASTQSNPTVAICHGTIATSLTTSDAIRVAIAGTPSGTCNYNVHVLEFSGVKLTSPVDASNANIGSSKIADSGVITLSNVDLVIGAIAWEDNAGIAGAGAPWVAFVDPAVSTKLQAVTEYLITSSSPQSATSTNDNGHQWAAAVVGYLPAP